MQKRGKPTEGAWWDASAGEEPEYTDVFDCKVNDGSGGIYPAKWIPFGKSTGFGNERGPGWKVLIPRQDGSGKNTVRFYPVTLVKRWLPADRKRRGKA